MSGAEAAAVVATGIGEESGVGVGQPAALARDCQRRSGEAEGREAKQAAPAQQPAGGDVIVGGLLVRRRAGIDVLAQFVSSSTQDDLQTRTVRMTTGMGENRWLMVCAFDAPEWTINGLAATAGEAESAA